MPEIRVGDSVITIDPSQVETWIVSNFQFRKHKNGQEYRICNPFDGDQKFKFNINIIKGVCHDWRPGHQHYDGSFIRFVQQYKGLSFYEAVREVCGQRVDLRSLLKPKKAEEIQEEAPEPSSEMPGTAKPFRKDETNGVKTVALNYLATRMVTLDIAKKYDLHYDVQMIYFPYREYDIPVYWQGRSITGKTFLFPENDESGSGKAQYLFGFDNVDPENPLFIVESNFNAISLGDGATSSGGAGMSKQQAKKVRALNPSRVILAPDNDYEGIHSIMDNTEMIALYSAVPCYFVLPPKEFKDWNEMHVKVGDQAVVRKWAEEHALPVDPANMAPLIMAFQR